MVGREYFHWFAGAGGDSAWLDDNLVVIEVELHFIAKSFEDLDVSSEFIDFVFEIREDMGGIIGFDEINNARYDVFPRLCIHEDEGNVKFFEFLLHQAEGLNDEIASCGAGAVPFEFSGRIDVDADERFGLFLG